MFRNVCRLCFGTDDLIWIFGDRMADNMKEIIHVTSGVEISRSDIVTQMVCNTCCQVTIKMYQFRTKSIKNDKDLKARCVGYNIAQLTNSAANASGRKEQANSTPTPAAPPPAITAKPKPSPPQIPQRYKSSHPSIKDIVRANPNIVLPESCLRSHVGAYITLLTDEVDDYYREKNNFTDAQIAQIKKEASERATGPKRPSPKRRSRAPRDDSAKRARLSVDSQKSREDPGDVVQNAHPPRTKTPKPNSNSNSDRSNSSMNVNFQNDILSPILKSMLHDGKKLETNRKKDEITLKSLLKEKKQSGGHKRSSATTEDEFVNVETSSSSNRPHHSDSEDEIIRPRRIGKTSGFLTVPEEEFEFFTSRPFVDDKSSKTDRPSSVVDHTEDAQDGSRRPDEQPPSGNDSDSDRIVFDLDSGSSASSSTRGSDREKSSFAEALRLAPRATEGGSNQPDLSLVSFANKTQTLFICRVCDSHHSSLKEMRLHEKRTHTKCQFCNKRFRTLANRDEHVANACAVNRHPVKLKSFKLELKRVDQDEEIRKKYPDAFADVPKEAPSKEVDRQVSEEEDSRRNKDQGVNDDREATAKSNKNPEAAQKDNGPVIDVEEFVPAEAYFNVPSSFCDGFTADAIHELETFLNYAEVVPTKPQKNANSNTDDTSDDVICISDDEAEITSTQTQLPAVVTGNKSPEMSINVVNSEILNNVNIHDNDLNVLKSILSHNRIRQDVTKQLNQWNLTNNLIIDGSTPRVKIFKNLRKYLDQYKIPIEIKHSTTVSVQYQPRTPPDAKKIKSLWNNLPVKKLQPVAGNPQVLKSTNAQVAKTASPQAASKSPTQPRIVLNGQMSRSLLQQRSNPVQKRPPAVRKTPVTTQKKLVAVPTTRSNANSAPNTNVSTANLIFTSSSGTLTSTTPIVLNATCANNPVILNGTAGSMMSPYPFILVPSSLLPPSLQNYTVSTSSGAAATVTVESSVSAVNGAAVTSAVQPPLTVNMGAANPTVQPPPLTVSMGAVTSVMQPPPLTVSMGTALVAPSVQPTAAAVSSSEPPPLTLGARTAAATSTGPPPLVVKAGAPPSTNKGVVATSAAQPPIRIAAMKTMVQRTLAGNKGAAAKTGVAATSAVQPSTSANREAAAVSSAAEASSNVNRGAAVSATVQQSDKGAAVATSSTSVCKTTTAVSADEQQTSWTVSASGGGVGGGAGTSSVEEPSSIAVAQLESITQSLMPAPSRQETNDDAVTVSDMMSSIVTTLMNDNNTAKNPQPAIRVRNLKELS